MLWACELKPRSWWTENLNLVRICVELLHTLSVWLTDTRCPHYFVNNCNLLDNSLNVGTVTSKLMSMDEEYLSTWLINHYIGQSAQLCPFDISRLFDDVSTSEKLQKAVSEIVRWRLNTSLYDMLRAVDFAELIIPSVASQFCLTAHSCCYWVNELTKIDKGFFVYFSAFVLLNVSLEVSRNGFNDNLKDVIATTLGHNCNVLCPRKTELNTPELVELLQKSAVEHLTTYRQLVVREFGSVANVMIVTTDFEALYAYKHGDYQRCLQLSTQNVHTLLYTCHALSVPTLPEFTQLMDDDIVSLTALPLFINPDCREDTRYAAITQLTLSLYLMTQCQLNLGHSMVGMLDYIKVSQRKHLREHTLDHLTLKLIERKVLRTTLH